MQAENYSPIWKAELHQFEVDDQVIKTNKLKGITEMIINLDEVDNTNNLEDGKPSNSLLTYHVTSNEDFTSFKPQNPQYKKLKNGSGELRPGLRPRSRFWHSFVSLSRLSPI